MTPEQVAAIRAHAEEEIDANTNDTAYVVVDLCDALAALQQRVERLEGALRSVSRTDTGSGLCWCRRYWVSQGHEHPCREARAALADAGPGVAEGA